MKIGIDLTPLQGPHRMRGVGAVIINFINHLPSGVADKHKFIFYVYDDKSKTKLGDFLNIDKLNYEFIVIEESSEILLAKVARLFHTRIANMLNNNLGKISEWCLGDPRIKSKQDVDVFIQFDQNQPLPARRYCKSFLVLYDLIPYVLKNDYLWTYKIARRNGSSIKGALRHKWLRYLYGKTLRVNIKRAEIINSISNHTKADFVDTFGVNPNKINTTLLGINDRHDNKTPKEIRLDRYRKTSWGDLPKSTTLSQSDTFLFFAGGVDPRRKLVDLVAAYNNLRAQGYNIKLVLAGDTMFGSTTVPNQELQKYLKNSSYLDNIYFVGFVNEEQKDWLYQNALAFVYPSVYEGFGLPILEAMNYGTPVITYKNSSIPEVAGSAAIYAHDHLSIAENVKKLLNDDKLRNKYAKLGKKQAAKFSWEKTSTKILNELAKL